MASLGELNVQIGADIQPLTQGVQQASAALENFGETASTAVDAATNSIEGLYTQLNRLITAQSRITQSNPLWQQYEQQIDETTNRIQQLENAEKALAVTTQATAQTVQQSAQGFNGLNMVLRETHTLGISTTRGIVSLSYGMTHLAKEINAARAEGQGFGSIAGSLTSQLFSMESVVVLAGSAVALLAHHLLTAKEHISEYEKEVKQQTESTAKEMLSMQALLSVAKDENISRETRLAAIKKLRDEYGPYLKNVSDEKILSGEVADAINRINDALIAKMTLSLAEEKIKPILEKQIDAQVKLNKVKEDYNRLQQQVQTGQGAFGLKLGTVEMELAERQLSTFGERLNQGASEVNKYKNQVDNMIGSLKGLIEQSAGLDLKDPKGGKEAKEKVDEVTKAIQKMNAALAYEDDKEAHGLQTFAKDNQNKAKIVEDTIKQLEQLKVDPNNTLISKLWGDVSKYNSNVIQHLPLDFDIKSADPNKKIKPIPIEVDIEVAPYSVTKAREQLIEKARLIGMDVKNFIMTDGEKVDLGKMLYVDTKRATKAFEELSKSEDRAMSNKVKEYRQLASAISGVFNTVFEDLLTKGKTSIADIGHAIEQLIVKLIEAVAEAAILAVVLNATGLGGGASFGKLFTSSLGLTPHAEGGVFQGPTQLGSHLFGEAGPEFLVGQSRLQEMLKQQGIGQGQHITVSGRIAGQDILISNARATRQNNNRY